MTSYATQSKQVRETACIGRECVFFLTAQADPPTLLSRELCAAKVYQKQGQPRLNSPSVPQARCPRYRMDHQQQGMDVGCRLPSPVTRHPQPPLNDTATTQQAAFQDDEVPLLNRFCTHPHNLHSCSIFPLTSKGLEECSDITETLVGGHQCTPVYRLRR